MRAREYRLMEDCVELGAKRGWSRAHKHTEHPSESDIREVIVQAVMEEICERWVLDEPRCECDD
jgi:hypothetical protein